MSAATTSSVPELLSRIQRALHLNQRQLADLMNCSRRTIIRYYQRGGIILPSTWANLARATCASDRELAAELAARAGQTLVGLGLEALAPPATAAPTARRREPSVKHMADSVVCAAAEAMQATPQAMRAPLFAAFERAIALDMTAQDVLDALAPEKPAKSIKPAKG
jgi:hypothetical protein